VEGPNGSDGDWLKAPLAESVVLREACWNAVRASLKEPILVPHC